MDAVAFLFLFLIIFVDFRRGGGAEGAVRDDGELEGGQLVGVRSRCMECNEMQERTRRIYCMTRQESGRATIKPRNLRHDENIVHCLHVFVEYRVFALWFCLSTVPFVIEAFCSTVRRRATDRAISCVRSACIMCCVQLVDQRLKMLVVELVEPFAVTCWKVGFIINSVDEQ